MLLFVSIIWLICMMGVLVGVVVGVIGVVDMVLCEFFVLVGLLVFLLLFVIEFCFCVLVIMMFCKFRWFLLERMVWV